MLLNLFCLLVLGVIEPYFKLLKVHDVKEPFLCIVVLDDGTNILKVLML